MKRKHIAATIFVVIFGIIAIFPVVFVFTNSFMSGEEIENRYTEQITENNASDLNSGTIHFVNVGFIPEKPSATQYFKLFFTDPAYLRYFWNSVILVVPVLIGQCIIAPMAAFGFENLRWKYKEIVFFAYIVIMLMPMQLLLVPNFIVAGWLNIRDSYLAIILPAMFHPLGVFLIRQQIKGFPKEAMEAARLDGATEFQIYRKIVKPNMTSVIAALMVLLFADNWNIVDQAVVFINQQFDQPMSVFLNQIAGSDPQMFFAVSCFFVFPAVIVFLYGQDYLIEGISLSSLKN